MERGLEVLQTSDVELNTYPAVMPLIRSKPQNCILLLSRSLVTNRNDITCSLFTNSLISHSMKMMSKAAEFDFSALIDRLMEDLPINPVSGVLYQSTVNDRLLLSQPTNVIRLAKSLVYKALFMIVLIINWASFSAPIMLYILYCTLPIQNM